MAGNMGIGGVYRNLRSDRDVLGQRLPRPLDEQGVAGAHLA